MKSYLFCSILESAEVRSEMEVVLRCENYVQVDALTVFDFTMLYVIWLSFYCWCHAPFKGGHSSGRSVAFHVGAFRGARPSSTCGEG